MCIQLYLGADVLLPEIPFDVKRLGFWIEQIELFQERRHRTKNSDNEENARKHLSKRYHYRLGSHLGCGCGFDFMEHYPWVIRKLEAAGKPIEPESSEMGEFARNCRASSNALADYLEAATQMRTVEVLVCWLGKEADLPKKRRRITPKYFRGHRLHLGRGLRLEKGNFFLARSSWTRWNERRKLDGQKTRRSDRLPRITRSASRRWSRLSAP